MILVALVGPPGSGKSTLARFAAQLAQQNGHAISGFLSSAYGPRSPGASRYTLSILPSGPELPWATRIEGADLPYLFDLATETFVRDWAQALPQTDVVFLDEFGKKEARGDGWVDIWPQIRHARPNMVVLCVREDLLAQVEQHLGQPFDVRIHAQLSDAHYQVKKLFSTYADWVQVGKTGLWGGGIEVSLGSALHAFLVPARGLALVSLQAAVLLQGVRSMHQPGRIAWAGWIAAGAKALSPAGNRIRPMVAIAVQALLFGGTVHLLGAHVLGITLGAFLMGAWAAFQGLFLQWVLAGEALFTAYASAQEIWTRLTGWSLPSPALFVAGWALLWGACVAASAWIWTRMGVLKSPPRVREIHRTSPFAMLRSPSLWLSAGCIALLLLLAGTPVQAVLLTLLRIVTLSVLLGLVVFRIKPQRLQAWLRARGWWGWVVALKRTSLPNVEK